MRIAVVGAGALGLFYGAVLQKNGNDVHYLLRSDFEAINTHGVTVHSIDGDFHLPDVKGYRSSTEIGPVDLVLVGLKTFANHLFAELISPLIGDRTQILTLQNGLGNEEALAAIFGEKRILGGVAFLCSNRGEPGVIHHLAEGRIMLGEFVSSHSNRAEVIASCFLDAGIECRVISDLAYARWEKLVWNIPFNGLCSLTLKPVDSLLNFEPTCTLIMEIMEEVITAANSQSLKRKIPLTLSEKMVVSSRMLGHYKPSMMIDRLKARPMELDAIFGIPLQRAHKQNVEMPRVRQLFALLQLMEKD